MLTKRILIVGDVFVDVALSETKCKYGVQLGGIFHSARALSAMQVFYGICYVAPMYLDNSISKFSTLLNCSYIQKLSTVDDSPNIMLIGDRFESGNQQYCDILRDQYRLSLSQDFEECLKEFKPTDVLLYPIKRFTELIIDSCNKHGVNIHIDIQYDDVVMFYAIESKCLIKSLFLSTSSNYFLNTCSKSVSKLLAEIKCRKIQVLVFKENRGGSRIVDIENNTTYDIPCYPEDIKHSVGVGDCYNSVFISTLCNGHENNGKLASIFASFYASTFEYNCFETRVKTFLKNSDEYIHQFSGKRLPWEDRSDIAIYIAAPDFPELNTQSIDIIEENLSYHGFTVNRPIKINGLVNDEMTRAEELSIYEKDVDLLNSSVLMVAILLNYDPGTLVEIGYFLKSNKPIILFDPTRVAKNMFLRNSVNCICYNINEITEKVFELASRGDNE